MLYFDNAATTFPKPEEVYDFTDKFYRDYGVNVGRGQHKQAYIANNLVNETRELIRDMFYCENKNVVFTNTATEAINIVLRGIKVEDGYNIYLSPFEHNAVTRVVHHMCKFYKLNVITLAVDRKTIEYDVKKIERQFASDKPNVLIMSHASNVCGVVAPIKEICELAKQYSAVTIIDMAQTAGLIDTDLSSDIYDFIVFAGHKTLYSPFGVAGFIFGNLYPIPLLYGGTGIDSANQELPSSVPERYEVGSRNIMAIAGLNASLKWIRKIGIRNIYDKEKYFQIELLKLLDDFDNIKVFKSKCESVGVVSCQFEGYSSDNIGNVLSEHDIAVRTGLHCAPNAHKFLGTYPAGTVRFSMSYFNELSELEPLQRILEYIYDNS